VAASAEAATSACTNSLGRTARRQLQASAVGPALGVLRLVVQGLLRPARHVAARAVPGPPPGSRRRTRKAAVSDPGKPIVYYLDPARRNRSGRRCSKAPAGGDQAFEAAGYRKRVRVELLPRASAPRHPLQRHHWVHRSTRGWSTGGAVIDPRTGRDHQGRGHARLAAHPAGLYARSRDPVALQDRQPRRRPNSGMALARIRQLSGATRWATRSALGHQLLRRAAGPISVMDYRTRSSRSALRHVRLLEVYAVGMGEWDKVSIIYGYQDFSGAPYERAALARILDEAAKKDLKSTCRPGHRGASARGPVVERDRAAAELTRMMEVRRVALSRFGENAIKLGEPVATMEEVLLRSTSTIATRWRPRRPCSAASTTATRCARRPRAVHPGDGGRAAGGAEALLATITPSALALPASIVSRMPPRPDGYDMTRELFPRYTGVTFDVITPAVVAATHTLASIFEAERRRAPRSSSTRWSLPCGARRGDRPGRRRAGRRGAGGFLRSRDCARGPARRGRAVDGPGRIGGHAAGARHRDLEAPGSGSSG